MPVYTKNQVLNFIEKRKNESMHDLQDPAKSSARYWTWGIIHKLVENEIIPFTDLQAEFPEINTP